MQAIVGNLLTNYEDEGHGPVILLLHGWGDNSAGLKVLRTELAKDYRVITPDLSGFGASEPPKSAWDLSDYAESVKALLQKISIDKTFATIGHSNGGAIAIRGLASGQLQADKLVLLASAGVRGEAKNRNLAVRYVAKTGKQFAKILPKSSQQKLKSKAYKTIGSEALVAEHMQATFKKIVADDVRGDAAKITIPTLLVYGENDEQTPPRYGRIYHELIKKSRLELILGAGHFLYLDAAETVLSILEDFLK